MVYQKYVKNSVSDLNGSLLRGTLGFTPNYSASDTMLAK